jgi:two-component system cell cycle response regulator
MSGHALIVDTCPQRRARLRAALEGAHLPVSLAGDPDHLAAIVAAISPELLVLDLGDAGEALGALRQLCARPGAPPVVALAPGGRGDLRLAALAAGAHDAAPRDLPERLLLARVRSLLRARAQAQEFGLPPEVEARALSEAAAPFAGAEPRGRLAVLALGPDPSPAATGLGALLGLPAALLPPDASPADIDRADLVVIDAALDATEALSVLAGLRARAATRGAATLLVLPEGEVATAVLALDLGAGDVVAGSAPPEEVALRARALLARKAAEDGRWRRLRSRLEAALTDPLTGLHNRRHADAALPALAARSEAAGGELALMLLDIDHFKSFNDAWGHAAGDAILREVARRLRAAVRPQDLLARVGGEEFVVAMPDTGAEAARAAAEGLRHAVERRPFAFAPPAGSRPRDGRDGIAAPGREAARVTVSIGVAIASPESLRDLPVSSLLDRADAALYAAKTAGRNMVAMALGAA